MKKNIKNWCLLLCLLLATPSITNAAEFFLLKKPDMPGRLRILWQNFAATILSPRLQQLFANSHTGRLMQVLYRPQLSIIEPAAGSKAVFLAQSQAISVITANLMLFPSPLMQDHDARLREFARAVINEKPDLICLQEVWDNRSLQELCRLFPDYYSVFKTGYLYNQSGLLVLSRFKVASAKFTIFPLSLRHNAEEILAGKGILSCTIMHGKNSLLVQNTHLYSAPPGQKYRPNPEQFDFLLQETARQPLAAIICGDMNLPPEEVDRHLKDFKAISRDNCQLPTAGFPTRKRKLDYIMVRNSIAASLSVSGQRLEWPVLFSDHAPVKGHISVSALSDQAAD
jgi:endonuclease/exonuclease/phosphatase family metal-dependent hydrolase